MPLRRIQRIAWLLDARFKIPGTNIRFGWDGLLGVIPVIGDTISILPQFYLLFEAVRLKMPVIVLIKMLGNILFDWLIGLVPVLGDIADVVFRSNLRNAQLLSEAIREMRCQSGK